MTGENGISKMTREAKDKFTSIVRTFVPMVAGALLSLGAQIGLELPEEALTELLTVLLMFLYYSVIRFAEDRWPWMGWFLGFAKKPHYEG